MKAFRTVLPFLSFKSFTIAYLVKTYITHNKCLTLLLFEDNDPFLAKSSAQILPSNLELNFLFLNFLITALFNSSGSCSLHLLSILFSYQKSYRP